MPDADAEAEADAEAHAAAVAEAVAASVRQLPELCEALESDDAETQLQAVRTIRIMLSVGASTASRPDAVAAACRLLV